MQLTIKGILSFPHLNQPRAVKQGDEPKYSANLLIPKGDPQLNQLQQAIDAEKANGFPSGFPHNGKVCLHDCAVSQPNNPELAGYMELRASAKADSKPTVVDMNMTPVMDPALVYPGAVVWMAINTFTYNMTTSKGVGAGLNGVMITGEEGALGRLDSKPTAEQMFAGVAQGGAPAAAMPPGAPAPAPTPAPTPAPAPAPAPAPTPATPPPAAPPQPQYTMTAKANGATREAFHAQGWTDEMLLQHGYMVLPGGVTPSFAS